MARNHLASFLGLFPEQLLGSFSLFWRLVLLLAYSLIWRLFHHLIPFVPQATSEIVRSYPATFQAEISSSLIQTFIITSSISLDKFQNFSPSSHKNMAFWTFHSASDSSKVNSFTRSVSRRTSRTASRTRDSSTNNGSSEL